MTNALTSTLFNDLKKEYTKSQFLDANPAKASVAIQQMSEQLDAMQKSHKPLTRNRETFEFISKVKPIHLFNPAFRDKARTDSVAMIKEYRAAAEDCDHLMDQLRRDQIKLTNYLASIPHPSTHANSKVKKDMDNLHQKLSTELAEVDKALEFYEKVQNNLSGENDILQAIDEAVAGRKNYIYNIQGSVKAHPPCAREALPPLPGGANPLGPNRTQVTSGGSTEEVQNFLLEKEIPQGMVKAFDVSYEVTTTPSATNRTGKVNTVGRFTQSHPSELEAVSTSKNGTVSKISHSRFEIEAFPQGNEPEFDVAKVNFAMAAAVAILASRDTVPSKEHPLILKGEKEEEMRYLWTALVKLGEDPNMKFDVSAIKVNSSSFKPDTQLGTLWGFSSDSLYEKQFKNVGAAAVAQKKEHLAEVTTAKFGHSDEQQKSEKSIGLFRTEVQDLRDKGAKSIEEEGPAFTPRGPGR